MTRLPANRADVYPTLFFADIIKNPEGSYAKLPNRRYRLERRHKVVQEFAPLRFHMGCMSQLRPNSIQKYPTIIGAEAVQIFLDPLRKCNGE